MNRSAVILLSIGFLLMVVPGFAHTSDQCSIPLGEESFSVYEGRGGSIQIEAKVSFDFPVRTGKKLIALSAKPALRVEVIVQSVSMVRVGGEDRWNALLRGVASKETHPEDIADLRARSIIQMLLVWGKLISHGKPRLVSPPLDFPAAISADIAAWISVDGSSNPTMAYGRACLQPHGANIDSCDIYAIEIWERTSERWRLACRAVPR